MVGRRGRWTRRSRVCLTLLLAGAGADNDDDDDDATATRRRRGGVSRSRLFVPNKASAPSVALVSAARSMQSNPKITRR